MEGEKKMKKKFKKWMFSIFKDQIISAHQQSFGSQLSINYIRIEGKEYRFEKITCRSIVDHNHSWRRDREGYEAGLHAKNKLSHSLYNRAEIKTHIDNLANHTIVDAYLYVGVRVK